MGVYRDLFLYSLLEGASYKFNQESRSWNLKVATESDKSITKMIYFRPRAKHDWLCRRLHGGGSQEAGTRQEGGSKET